MTYTINGQEINAKELTFNALCELSEMGVEFSRDITERPLLVVRAYLAYCMNTTPAKAGEAIENHVVNGGDLQGIKTALFEMVEKSGFFHGLSSQNQTETTEQTTAES